MEYFKSILKILDQLDEKDSDGSQRKKICKAIAGTHSNPVESFFCQAVKCSDCPFSFFKTEKEEAAFKTEVNKMKLLINMVE